MAQAKEKATDYTQKTAHKTRGAGFASQKVYCFSCLYAMPPPEQNRWFPNRPVCILWCSFSMLKAILTRYHSTITLALPLVRKRRKFMSSLTMANTPSAWMERLTRSRIPSSDGIVIRRTMPFQQIHEIHILTAGSFYFSCPVNPTGPAVKNDFKKQTR